MQYPILLLLKIPWMLDPEVIGRFCGDALDAAYGNLAIAG
jgi:hypothetical protein